MSLYGAMFSGVTGLNTQTQSMAMISDNVANVNTTGYKEVSARFSTLVTNSISQGLYTSGGVRSLPLQIQDKQGLLQGSATSTDIAVNGDGFFVVSDVPEPTGAGGQYFFTRAGSFRPDDNGNLVNTAGMYLQAWPYNSSADNTDSAVTENGIVYGTDGLPVNKTDFANVEAINLADFTGVAQATTAVDLRVNLDASQPQQVTAISYLENGVGLGGIPASASSVSATAIIGLNTMSGNTTVPDFQRSITVYDAQGVSHDLTMSFLKMGVDPNLPTLTETITSTSTTGTGTSLVVPSLVGRSDIPSTGSLDFANSTATPASGTVAYTNFDPNTGTFTFGSSAVWSGPAQADVTFPIYQPVANQWAVELSSSDAYSVHPHGIVGFGTMVFNTNGSLDTNNSSMFVGDYSAGSLVFNKQPLETAGNYEIAWNPATTGASGSDTSALIPQTINNINFGTNSQTDGMSQFQGTSTLYSHDVDGALFGNFVGVTVDNEGWVVANFSNGLSQATHKIPLATVPNPAALANKTGNAYQATADSGSFNLNEPGTGNAGLIAGAALEQSTVDLGTEFTNMIITQRAYSATSKIITTADEMLDELVRLKR